MIPPAEALERLQQGNRRFVTGLGGSEGFCTQARRLDLLEGQRPFAVVLGCSDSRVPTESVFDQGLGDLFVIRVAGNIVAPSQVGSVEFAVAQYDVRLVVVLGHSRCGAVSATLDELRRPAASRSPNLRTIVDRVRPSVEALLEADPAADDATLIARAVRANVRVSTDHLRHGSQALERLADEGRLLVVGAEYSLETGEVDFFDVPSAGPG